MEFVDCRPAIGPRNTRQPNSGKFAAFPRRGLAPAESRQAEGPALEDQVEDPDDDQKPDKEDDADDPAQDAQHGCPPVAIARITNTRRFWFTADEKSPAARRGSPSMRFASGG